MRHLNIAMASCGGAQLWQDCATCGEREEVADFRSFQYFWSISMYIDSYRSLRHAFQYFCNSLYLYRFYWRFVQEQGMYPQIMAADDHDVLNYGMAPRGSSAFAHICRATGSTTRCC